MLEAGTIVRGEKSTVVTVAVRPGLDNCASIRLQDKDGNISAMHRKKNLRIVDIGKATA